MAYKLISGNPAYKEVTNNPNLKEAALRFINHSCEDLRFSIEISEREKKEGQLEGVSLKKGQIPYNEQMDIDRLCLEYSLTKFLDRGNIQDAYNVYYCFIEMFIGNYHTSRKMIEFLSEFERNGSSLLMKHRDHYSHSVYVFALGLAIYETNPYFRETYKKFYKNSIEAISSKNCIEDIDKSSAHHYLEHWGMTSLFHDIGYPFELPFEQIENYFDQTPGNANASSERRKESPFMSYNMMDRYVSLDEYTSDHFSKLYGQCFDTTDELFAYVICQHLGTEYHITNKNMVEILREKTSHPEKFNYFMDHAYFSSLTLFREMLRIGEMIHGEVGKALDFTKDRIDCLVAILLHNSLFKFSVSHYKEKIGKPLDMKLFPLAYMLMLCDELQVWDRTAYGRESKTQLHPMGCDFVFKENGSINANYIFDEKEKHKIDSYLEKWEHWKLNLQSGVMEKPPKFKSYDGFFMSSVDWNEIGIEDNYSMISDIRKIVSLGVGNFNICIDVENRAVSHSGRRHHTSDINVIGLFNLAVAIHNRSRMSDVLKKLTDEMIGSFENLSLEYKLGCLCRAENFDDYLEEINAFMSDKPVDCEMLESFSEEETAKIGRMEHLRWMRYHIDMGWKYGTEFSDKSDREQKRIHNMMIPGEMLTDEMIYSHYDSLPSEEQDKDTKPMNAMLVILKEFDGVRIYRE